MLLELLYSFYPLRFLSTNRNQSPVFIARFSSMVKNLLSKSDTWWLADEKKKATNV